MISARAPAGWTRGRRGIQRLWLYALLGEECEGALVGGEQVLSTEDERVSGERLAPMLADQK